MQGIHDERLVRLFLRMDCVRVCVLPQATRDAAYARTMEMLLERERAK